MEGRHDAARRVVDAEFVQQQVVRAADGLREVDDVAASVGAEMLRTVELRIVMWWATGLPT